MTTSFTTLPHAPPAAEPLQLVVFRLGDDDFAADVHAVERVLRHAAPRSVPDLPPWMEGVVDHAGRVVPLIDLRARFGLPTQAPTAATRTLVFDVGGDLLAGVVDAVLDVTTLDARALEPPPPLFRGLAGAYLRGLVRQGATGRGAADAVPGERLVLVLDVARVLTSTERLTLAAVAAVGAGDAAPPAGQVGGG